MQWIDAASLFCTIFGVMIFFRGFFGNLKSAMPLALEFWMAAGLLHLSGSPGWKVILTIGIFVIVRKLITELSFYQAS